MQHRNPLLHPGTMGSRPCATRQEIVVAVVTDSRPPVPVQEAANGQPSSQRLKSTPSCLFPSAPSQAAASSAAGPTTPAAPALGMGRLCCLPSPPALPWGPWGAPPGGSPIRTSGASRRGSRSPRSRSKARAKTTPATAHTVPRPKSVGLQKLPTTVPPMAGLCLWNLWTHPARG